MNDRPFSSSSIILMNSATRDSSESCQEFSNINSNLYFLTSSSNKIWFILRSVLPQCEHDLRRNNDWAVFTSLLQYTSVRLLPSFVSQFCIGDLCGDHQDTQGMFPGRCSECIESIQWTYRNHETKTVPAAEMLLNFLQMIATKCLNKFTCLENLRAVNDCVMVIVSSR